MATTVNILQQSFTAFGWSEANFDWDSTRADKPWDEIGKCSFLLDVGEGIAVTDEAARSCIKPMKESFKVTETQNKNISKNHEQSLIIGDQATPATLLQISNASAAPVKQIVVDGKSTQVQTTQGNNLCPSFKYWTLENGAYIDGDSVILPNENSVAYCDINWKYRSSFLGLGYESITSIAVENNPRTLFSIIYYDINYTQLGINGHAKNIINNTRSEEYFGNTNPQATSYSLAISQSYKIRIKILRDNTYATYPYGVKNIVIQDLVQNPTFLPYEPFIPDSPSPDYPSPISSAGDSGSIIIRKIGRNIFNKDEFKRICLTDTHITEETIDGKQCVSGTCDRFYILSGQTANRYNETNNFYNFEPFLHLKPKRYYFSIRVKNITLPNGDVSLTFYFITKSNSNIAVFAVKGDTTGWQTFESKNINVGEEIIGFFFSYSYGCKVAIDLDSIYMTEEPEYSKYHPYTQEDITIPLSKPLLSVPNGAADRLFIDNNNKRAWIERNCEKYTFTGYEYWATWGVNYYRPDITGFYLYFKLTNINIGDIHSPTLSNYFKSREVWGGSKEGANVTGSKTQTSNYFSVGIYNTCLTNISSNTEAVNSFKSWIKSKSNDPVYIVYGLVTPYTEEIPWSDSYFLNTNTGINNIFCTDKVNANISVAYEADTIAKTIVKAPFKESTRIEPSLGFELCKHIQDMFSLFDTFRLYVAKTTREQIHISETYWDNIFFTLRVLESFIIADKASRAHSRRFSDSFVVSDRITKKIVLNKSELLDIFDEFKRIFTSTRTFFENAKITDKAFKEMTSEQKECAVLTEFLSKSILALKTENLSLNDNFKRSVDFIRNVSEGFITGDDLRKTFGLNKRESIEVLDAFIRACNSIIADIAIDSEELDINKFLNIVKTPQGYTPFQEFNVGDYEYKEALIRFIIEVAEAQSEPLVRDVEHNVDIEEVIDRGIVSITDATAPTKIFFNKTYYTPPFVQVTLKGGSTVDSGVYPNILSTDQKIGVKRYFEIELINSRGERTIGVISWTSTGY